MLLLIALYKFNGSRRKGVGWGEMKVPTTKGLYNNYQEGGSKTRGGGTM